MAVTFLRAVGAGAVESYPVQVLQDQQYGRTSEFSTEEVNPVATWLLWKRAHEIVRLQVMADVAATTGIAETELSVLVQLHEAGGTLRQNVLALSTGWDRTRLSHLLTRLEARGQVARTRLTNGVEVSLQPAGSVLFETARPALEAAVRRHLFERLGADELAALQHTLEVLTA